MKENLFELNIENFNKIFNLETEGKNLIDFILNKDNLIELELENCIIYELDKVISDKISEIEIEKDNIQEAIFFSKYKEIKLYKNDIGKFIGTIFEDKYIEEDKIEIEYLLYPRYREENGYAEKMKVIKYIDYDEDNQGYIFYTRPVEFQFKEGK